MKKIGLLAGAGRLPVECAIAAKTLGYEVYAVALLADTDSELKEHATDYAEINVAKVGSIFKFLKKNGVTEVTMLGKVTKELLFSGKHALPDLTTIKILASMRNHKDDTMMLSVVRAIEEEGFTVADQTALLKPLMPKAGVITHLKPTEAQLKDMEFGLKMAKAIGGLDVGQTVVVKDLAVMALEAIEGTDACIERGGKLARGGAVVAKTAKPNQDMRFDVPAVGLKTLEVMASVQAKALVIEAEQTLLVDKEKVVAFAEKNGITIVAM